MHVLSILANGILCADADETAFITKIVYRLYYHRWNMEYAYRMTIIIMITLIVVSGMHSKDQCYPSILLNILIYIR